MSTLAEVKERTRSLVEDEDIGFTTDAYLTPKINQAYFSIIGALLDSSCNPFETQVRQIPNLQAGTTDFIAQTGIGKPWEGLEDYEILEVKPAGYPSEAYDRVEFVAKLPNVSPITAAQVGTNYGGVCPAKAEWRGGQIYMTPLQFNFDAQLRAEFRPSKLVLDSDRVLVHWEMTELLSFESAILIGKARGEQTWITNYEPDAGRVFDSIASKLTKEIQGERFKFARFRGGRRRYR